MRNLLPSLMEFLRLQFIHCQCSNHRNHLGYCECHHQLAHRQYLTGPSAKPDLLSKLIDWISSVFHSLPCSIHSFSMHECKWILYFWKLMRRHCSSHMGVFAFAIESSFQFYLFYLIDLRLYRFFLLYIYLYSLLKILNLQ